MEQIINDKKIAILMATYNGETYLEEQLDSIIQQSNKEWKLFIRDDGSVDNTLAIIKKYVGNFENIVLVEDNLGSLGASGNFFTLLRIVHSSYYMFADQDDVWLPTKVTNIYLYMLELESRYTIRKPIIIGTDLKVVDAQLNTITRSFWKNNKVRVSLLKEFNYLAVCNGFTGCTMIMNNQVKRLVIPTLPTQMIHDYWIVLNVSKQGGVLEFMDEALILYRQHSSNVIGSQNLNKAYLFNRLRALNLVCKENWKLYKMINTICHVSIFKYLWYKLLYTIKR